MPKLMLSDEHWSKPRDIMLQHRIMASKRNGTLYVGSTVDLIKRVWEHKNKIVPGFTATYDVHMLVFYEVHHSYVEAARREKRFKNWPRQWKINLIEQTNSEWHDLYEDICL